MSIDVQFIALKLLKIVVVWTLSCWSSLMIYAERQYGRNPESSLTEPRGSICLLQPFADVLKFLFKEDIIPPVNKWLYLVARRLSRRQ
jgi:NADH:ubiquinone oxidoreductase subunit H